MQTPPAPGETGSKKSWIYVAIGAVVLTAVVVLGVVFQGGYFKGSFFEKPDVLKITVQNFGISDDEGTFAISYMVTNTGTDELPATESFTMKAYANDTVPLFEKPWNMSKTASMRAGESIAYTVSIPKDKMPATTGPSGITSVTVKAFNGTTEIASAKK